MFNRIAYRTISSGNSSGIRYVLPSPYFEDVAIYPAITVTS